jgi:hypothetical protein
LPISFGAAHAPAKGSSERVEISRLVINALTKPLTVPPPVHAIRDSQDDRDQSCPVVVPVRVFKIRDYRLKSSNVIHELPRSGPIQVAA